MKCHVAQQLRDVYVEVLCSRTIPRMVQSIGFCELRASRQAFVDLQQLPQ